MYSSITVNDYWVILRLKSPKKEFTRVRVSEILRYQDNCVIFKNGYTIDVEETLVEIDKILFNKKEE